MVYASSRDALKRALTGVAVEVQGTDYGEVAYENGESFLIPVLHHPRTTRRWRPFDQR